MQNGAKIKDHLTKEPAELESPETELIKSEARFRNLMEYIPGVSIQGYRPDGTVVYWNKASEKIYGYTAREAIGSDLGDLIIPPDLEPLFRKSLREGEKASESGEFLPAGELVLLHKKGHPVPVYSIHTAVCIKGSIPLLFCIDVDLSERKKMEEELKEYSEKLEEMVDNRTAELKERIAELERFQDATVEREFRIKELSDEVERLQTQIHTDRNTDIHR
jgi:PAS domain S-box-containing protein